MAGGSSSNPRVAEDREEYPHPYPSHVFVPSFVSVKLNGREMYGLWKAQMLCLLEAHGMLGFIYTSNSPPRGMIMLGKEKEADDYSRMLWRRSDALVKGWMLGSFSEHVLRHVINILNTYQDFTAKDVWDKLQSIYGPSPPFLQQPTADSALILIENYGKLHSDAVLMAIAQNFPRELKFWERSIVDKFFREKEPSDDEDDDGTAACCLNPLGAIFLLIFIVLYGIYKLLKYIIRKSSVIVVVRWAFKFVYERHLAHDDVTRLLTSACKLIKSTETSRSYHHYYTNPILEATRQNAYKVVVSIVSFFPDALWTTNEDGHNIIQCAVINRSENVYNLLYQMSEHRNVYKTIKDPFGNNLLHLAARLAPTNKLNHISGAALQIQRELQWFKEVKGFVCPLNIMQKNSFGETPQMIFAKEHKELVIEGEKWMKATAESYTITAALITTVVFAAAITVPGGNNQETGIPLFTNKTAFTIFAISDAISLFTSTTSLLMFLSILTTRYA